MGYWCKARQPLPPLLPQVKLPKLDTIGVMEHRWIERTEACRNKSEPFLSLSNDTSWRRPCPFFRFPCQVRSRCHIITDTLYHTYLAPSHSFTLSRHVCTPNGASDDSLNLLFFVR